MEFDTLAATGERGKSDPQVATTPATDSQGVTSGSDVTATATPTPQPKRRRRQWGAEKPRPALPMREKPAATSATWLGGLAMTVTVVAWATYIVQVTVSRFIDDGFSDSRLVIETVLYAGIMTLLLLSALMYLLARQGALYRSRSHVRVPRAEIDAHMGDARPSMTVLVPSYAEEPSVVRSTLMSAALQEYPGLRIVLLIDDPQQPKTEAARKSLEGCRALPSEIEALLRGPYERFAASLAVHEAHAERGGASSSDEVRSLALDFRWAAAWLREQADAYPRFNHADDFFVNEVYIALAKDFETTAQALFGALDEGAQVPASRIAQLCRRLVWTFDATLTSFERKAYAHLPHDANKAMNLNAYIGLMGSRKRAVETRLGRVLRDAGDAEGDDIIEFPDSDYLLTLDADSVLLREYCLRLVHQLELPGNERIAVIQTPYSAFRGADTRLERIAGATTDIQHILHQGLTHFDATFWVGANAVIRKVALNDIVETTYVKGQAVHRYVQDRTVIEDTESSIDLVENGWSLYNYPERLSYSATPPDYGSLVVQRARWANGGLLIAPKFLRYMRRERKAGRRVRRSTIALRLNYMVSISWASFGLLFLLGYWFDSRLLSPIIVAAALPYFLAMAADFRRLGYKRSDVFRVYAFNLILLPVNLAGTLKSLQQAAAKSKIAFARTPKVKDRTATPALYVLFAYAIALFSFYTLLYCIRAENWANGAFALFNGVLTTYAIIAFIGVRASITDVFLGFWNWIRVPAQPKRAKEEAQSVSPDWESVLYFGPDYEPKPGEGPSVAATTSPAPRRGDTRSRVRT